MKRYRKRARKTYRKKRRFMRKRRSYSKKYDGGTSIKCHTFTDLTYNSLYSSADATINWGSLTATPNEYLRIS